MQFSNIKWINNQPYSIDFNDIYFSTDNGLQETEYVFIAHNHLKLRFAALDDTHFTIIETGFGTGLNFLSVCAHWLALTPVEAQLHYISIEKYPLSLTDLTRAHALWPQFTAISQELAQHYINLKSGINIFNIAGSRIHLSLWAGDILSAMPQISQIADAWILDGFAPAKNPEMWSSMLFAEMARLSKPDTTFATFTSAGIVRRGLQEAGFQANKHKGFGEKCEMLSGVFTGSKA
jgi:tRNA 5-methylaminomethyl-2-thiouridine biosynthesis bifunctional protein